MHAQRVNVRNGIDTCTQCGTRSLLGLCVYVLPMGPTSAQHIAPDTALPPAERTQEGIRRRSRKRRIEFLRSVGLEDPMLPSSPKRYVAGQPINRVVIVPAPPGEAVNPVSQESSNPTNPVTE